MPRREGTRIEDRQYLDDEQTGMQIEEIES